MLLTTNNKVKTKNKAKLAILKELTHNSKDLYNKALYTIKQHFFFLQKSIYHIQKFTDFLNQAKSIRNFQAMQVSRL